MLKLIPNFITFFRLALVPVLVFLLIEPGATQQLIALVIFVIAAITDWLDGYLARKLNAISDFGKLIDPIADKILVMTVLVMLIDINNNFGRPWVQAWMVVLILARETWVTGLRALAGARGKIMPAGMLGKLKSFFQMLAICCLLCNGIIIFESTDYKISAEFIGETLLMFSIVLSYWGAAEYTWQTLENK